MSGVWRRGEHGEKVAVCISGDDESMEEAVAEGRQRFRENGKCPHLWGLSRWAQGLSCGGEPYGPSSLHLLSRGTVIEAINKKRDLKGKILCLIRDLLSLKFLWDRIHFL